MVMLILTAVLGLVLPRASSVFFRSDLKASTRRLAGAVAYARSQAMLEDRRWELALDLDAGTFWTRPAADPEGLEPEPARKRSLAGEVRFLDIQRGEEETRRAGEVGLRFQANGLVEPAVVHLAGPGERVQTLRIKPFNGRLAIFEGYVGREEQEELQKTEDR